LEIKEDIIDTSSITLKRWMVVGVLTVATLAFTSAVWITRIEDTVGQVASEIPQIRKDSTIALQVLADHGSDFRELRDIHLELRQEINRIEKTINERTSDRWNKSDALREWEYHRKREHTGIQGEVPHTHIEPDNHQIFPNPRPRVAL
jgi:hypothetical protein